MSTGAAFVVGIDRSAESAAALAGALRLTTALNRPLVVVHAVGLLEEGGYRSEPEVDEIIAGARAAVPGSEHADVSVVREDGPAIDVILRVAERIGAEVIAVGRRGLGEAPRPLGSVSEGLLARAHVPVLVVPGA